MALVAGSVTVDNAGVATGSGMSLALYQAKQTAEPLLVTSPSHWKLAQTVAFRRQVARDCNALGSGIVTYLLANL